MNKNLVQRIVQARFGKTLIAEREIAIGVSVTQELTKGTISRLRGFYVDLAEMGYEEIDFYFHVNGRKWKISDSHL